MSWEIRDGVTPSAAATVSGAKPDPRREMARETVAVWRVAVGERADEDIITGTKGDEI